MPVNEKMMASMRKQYGAKKGKHVYYALENKLKHSKSSKLKNKLHKMFNA